MNFLVAASQALTGGFFAAYLTADGAADEPVKAGLAAVCALWSLIGLMECWKDGKS